MKNNRTLLLTDSILNAVNPQSLTTSKHEICVKKMLYYITDFSNYEAEFEYTDKVTLSAGINDITRRYMTPENDVNVIIPQLRRFS